MSSSRKSGIMQRFGSRSQAERYRDRFEKGWRRRTHERETQALGAVLGMLGRMGNILDVGCGPGRFVPLLVTFARRLIQTDYSKHMLDVSRQDYPLDSSVAGHIQADARSLPLANQSVEMVLCHRLLNHIPESAARMRILAEFARVTSRYAVISCLAPPRFLRLIRRLRDWIGRRVSLDGHVEESDLLQEAQAAGLRLVVRIPIRCFPRRGDFLVLEK